VRSIILGAFLAFVFSLFGTPFAIRWLQRLRIGQEIREEGPKHHAAKRGTPTMGGLVFILSTVVAYAIAQAVVLAREGRGPTVTAYVLLGLFVGMGAIGFVDDFIKVRKRRSLGLNKRGKIIGQVVVGVGLGVLAFAFPDERNYTFASGRLSFIREVDWLKVSAVGAIVIFVLLVVAVANAVNLTDGLDGLATGSSVMVLGGYVIIGFFQYRHFCGPKAPTPYCYEVRDPLEVAVICAAAAGALFGFLWWNAAPARIFMGDTGALGLGGLIAGVAMTTKTVLLLPVLGALFVAITLSVIIQIISFRTTGKRVFRMAPLQHHFELAGWEEVTIVIRFWIVAGISVAAGLGLFFADYLGVLWS
jgi:phospho-N-acetylmuramoyl-pentapeptide-transferase